MFLCFGVTGTKANSGKVKRIPDAKLAVGNNRPFVFKCCSYRKRLQRSYREKMSAKTRSLQTDNLTKTELAFVAF